MKTNRLMGVSLMLKKTMFEIINNKRISQFIFIYLVIYIRLIAQPILISKYTFVLKFQMHYRFIKKIY